MRRKDEEIMCGKFLEPVRPHLFSPCMRSLPPWVIRDPAPNVKLRLWAAATLISRRPLSWPAHFLPSRVKELTVDPNRVMEVGRPNVHGVNNMDLLNMEWLSISPQRDDLKLLCEQNVSASTRACRLSTERKLRNSVICCHICLLVMLEIDKLFDWWVTLQRGCSRSKWVGCFSDFLRSSRKNIMTCRTRDVDWNKTKVLTDFF